jgi:hypothetical protein
MDEHGIIINPVILGAGKLQFTGIADKKILSLANVKVLRSGVVILCYKSIQ